MLSLLILLVIATALCACRQNGESSPPQTPASAVSASVTLAPLPDEPQALNAYATPDEPLTSKQYVPGTLDPETGHYIIASATTDQFGDNEQYEIKLYTIGKPEEDSGRLAYIGVYLGIYGKEKSDEVTLDEYYDISDSYMFVGDFTGDGLVEVFVEIPIRSADGLAPTLGFIYSFDGKLRRIFDNDDMNPFAYIINFEDNYIVSVYNRLLGCSYRGDLTDRFSSGVPYYENVGMDPAPIYDDTGKAAPDIPHDDVAFLRDYTVVNDVTADGGCNKSYFLCVTEELLSRDINIYVGDIVSYLKWDSIYEKFVVAKQYYVPVGLMYFDSEHYWNMPQ